MNLLWKAGTLAAAILTTSLAAAEFNAEQLKWNLGPKGSIEKKEGKTFLKVSVPEDAKGVFCATAELNLKPYQGKMLVISGLVRGKNLQKAKGIRWGGSKFMVQFLSSLNEKKWPGGRIPNGTFEWTETSLKLMDFKDTATFYLGFQNGTGEIEFDLTSIKMKEAPLPANFKKPNKILPDVPLEGGHPLSGLKFSTDSFSSVTGNILTVTVPENAKNGLHTGNAAVDLSGYIGKTVQVSVLAKGKNVSKPKASWNGVKLMVEGTDFNGKRKTGSAATGLSGDFDWKLISAGFNVGEKDARIRLGLQASSGTVDFDLSTLKVRPLYSKDNANHKAVYDQKVKNTPSLRGVMLPQRDMTEADLKVLADWNVNLVRFQICRNWLKPYTDRDPADYDKWFEGRFQNLKWLASIAGKYGIRVVVDMHTPPGGRLGNKDMCLFSESVYAAHFIQLWKKIAAELKGNPNIWAYDLVNEPQSRLKNGFDWWKLQYITAQAIRKIDPDTPIVIATNWGNGPWCWNEQKPLEMKNIIYQVHMYNPMQFTHQLRKQSKYLSYPGEYTGKKGKEVWDKEFLRKVLKDVRAFQLKHGVRIYAGEFSAVVWAPGAEQYLKDCIELFEEYGWDWSYHSFREASCWSLEMEGSGPGKLKPSVANPRKAVLLKAFEKNRK